MSEHHHLIAETPLVSSPAQFRHDPDQWKLATPDRSARADSSRQINARAHSYSAAIARRKTYH
ncbi:hypothetical protein CCR75_004051 [Bremia lactucae]|uniref:Uncharacterized protein n=1 Tax=Bremia lactucae TaxID=4779 RepID=A0A976FFM6_BRELC|nr:hypothetical protein CCR75_004051 [Bremia lactucae]